MGFLAILGVVSAALLGLVIAFTLRLAILSRPYDEWVAKQRRKRKLIHKIRKK